MAKELFVSSTPHETKVAIVEEDQLAEIYFERENEYTLAGSIYKGKVTRVLPGMQSAFVDLGLERDAFLYVTDFLEEQEDQEEFEQVVTQAHDTALGDGPAAPIEAEQVLPPTRNGNGGPRSGGRDFSQPVSNAATVPGVGGEEEPRDREGGRRWRGRRRRGRRGRGFPESKFAGERGEQPAESAREEMSEAPPRVEAPRAETPRAEAPPRPSGYQPIVLPGESISKYRNVEPLPGESFAPRSEPRESRREMREEREERRPREPREERGPREVREPRGFQPRGGFMPLPGESIAKYQESAPQAAFGEQRAAVEAEEQTGMGGEPAAVELPQESRAAEREDERRFEQMNVASVFGGAEATQAAEPTSATEPGFAPRAEAQPAGFAPGAGVVEEEEIEDEELDLELPGEDEGADFEELEEETLEAGGAEELIAAGNEVTEAVRDTHVEERATGHYESLDEEDEDEGDEGADFEELETEGAELQESEALAEAEEGEDAEMEGDEPGASDRAELRGPAGTAGLQRAPERGGRRERERGRRGRRGRGGRMRGGRRNIQSGSRPAINELLKEGQEILVQIAKEPMGKKGARITSHIALPGRFLVYMPTVAHIGVSRKIGSDEERQRLKRILLSERDATRAHGGFIVRTAAAGASEDDLRADIRFLVNLWNEIRQRAEQGKAPSLIYHDLNLVERILRDQVTQDFSAIWVDNEQEYERILRFVGRFQPSLVRRVKLYTKDTPLFEQFNIQEEINKALKSKVWLKSGGYIVINQTEALVAIDVNTGKYVGKTGRLEDTIVKTNVDAIKEIVRQIRLRDLGGIIVIDFIDMDERKNRQKVMQALEEALRRDRAPSKVLQFNDFGLVAITRKRVKQSLERTLGQPCPYCTGTGLVKSVATVCNEIYVEMRKLARHMDKGDVILRVNPEVAKALKASGARWLGEMEDLVKRTVLVKSDPTLHQEQFDIQ